MADRKKVDSYRKIVEDYIDAYNRLDVDGMLADADPEIEFENISSGEVTLRTKGIEDLRKQARESARFFVERRQEITAMTVREDEVEVEVNFTGILAADLSEELRAGHQLRLKGRSIFRFRQDRIVELTDIS